MQARMKLFFHIDRLCRFMNARIIMAKNANSVLVLRDCKFSMNLNSGNQKKALREDLEYVRLLRKKAGP